MLNVEKSKTQDDEVSFNLGEIDEILGFHIRLAHGAVYRHFTDTFSDLGLTQKQVSVLWLTEDNVGLAQADLCRLLQMDRATIMAIVNSLQKRGYIKRRPSKKDGRKQILELTKLGAKSLERAKRAVKTHEKWLRSRFSESEIRTLIGMLKRIHD